MIRWRKGEVVRIRREWPGAVELDVEPPRTASARALAYPALVGRPEPGDAVLLNTTALAMGLGTGGYAMVVAIPDRLPEDPPGPGHLVKARYTPLQATVLGADEQDSPYHEVAARGRLPGRHAGDRRRPALGAARDPVRPVRLAPGDRPRVAYVMLDGGALPAWFSMSVRPAAGGRLAVRGGHGRARRSAATWRR